MIFVKEHSPGFLAVEFKPIGNNLKRIKQLPGAKFNGQKAWVIPLGVIHEFEELFKGEFIWVTPRHKVLGEAPPPPPVIYSKIPSEDPHSMLKQGTKLYNYQTFGANFLAFVAYHTGHAFLTDKVGTGKTCSSIAGGKLLESKSLVENTIVFCKASLKYQWLSDGVEKFTNDKGIVIDGTKAKRIKQYAEALGSEYKYVIMNYELLLHDFDEVKDLIEKKNINLAICDEAHRVVNHKGKMNNALMKLTQPKKKPAYKGIEYVFYLTATPLASKIEQLFGLFQIRRPDYFGKFTEFVKKHLLYSFNGRSQELVGYKNLDELREKIVSYMLRRTDAEIDMELPDMHESHVRVAFTGLQKQLDTLALGELESLGERLNQLRQAKAPEEQIEAVQGTMKAMMYVRKAIADHPQLLTRGNSAMIREKFGNVVDNHKDANKSPKLDELMDLVQEMVVDGDEKLIIFSEFATMVNLLKEEFDKKGIHCVTYTGADNTQQKHEKVMEFKNNPDCKIFIATDAGAEGINLQFAPYLINFDMPWNPSILEQRMGRIRRGGSTYEKVKVIHLIAENSIDEAVLSAIQSKQNLFNFLAENTEEQTEELKRVMYGER